MRFVVSNGIRTLTLVDHYINYITYSVTLRETYKRRTGR